MQILELFPHQRTDIYQAALALVKAVRGKIGDAYYRDQAERAAGSCLLAIGEGLPHRGVKMRRQYFERAHCSLCELVTTTHTSLGLGAMAEEDWRACQAIALRVRAMLIALLR